MTTVPTKQTAQRRRFEGVVVSTKENKTIHVKVKSIKTHPKYDKQYSRDKKYAVHDENAQAHVGDTVLFEECRPLSKTKRWTLVKVLVRARS
ncbi:MAG TPA: 30S ribosomal protein S17 [Candidatus Magasanikbacteria bacterium]|nr:30S ribosomal protein S17 [Candidatus Magasanikbacteria bacterium]